MTRDQIERKLKHLRKEIIYLSRVFPNSQKLNILKSEYRYYNRVTKLTK